MDLRLTRRVKKGSANDLIEATWGTVKVRAFNRLSNRLDPSTKGACSATKEADVVFPDEGAQRKNICSVLLTRQCF